MHGGHFFKGLLKEAEGHLLKAVEPLQKSNQGFGAGAKMILAWTYFAMKDYKRSQQFSEQAVFMYRKCNLPPSYLIATKIFMALSRVMDGEKDIDLNEVINEVKEIKSNWFKGLALNYIGAIVLNKDSEDISQAEDWINKAIESQGKTEQGHRKFQRMRRRRLGGEI